MTQSSSAERDQAGVFSVWRTARLLVVVALLGVLVFRLFGIAERMAYLPSRDEPVTPQGAEDLWLTPSDGLRLHAWFFRASDAEPGQVRPAVLHLHGNAGTMGDHTGFSEFLPRRGVHALMLDYRGYGKSDPGRLRRDAVLRDAHAGLDALLTRDDVGPIGVYGVSLGGAFALKLAGERDEIDRVATLSTFSTWRGASQDLFPVLGPLLMPGGWDPIDGIEGLGDRPCLIVHGDDDEVLDARHAPILRDAAQKAGVDVRMVIIEDGRHNTTLETGPEAKTVIGNFFAAMSSETPSRSE